MSNNINSLVMELAFLPRKGGQSATFYSYFLSRMNKVDSPSLPAPAGVGLGNLGKPTLYINWDMMNQMFPTSQSKCGVLIHEVEHLIREHLTSRKPASSSEHKIYNIGQDWAINQYIPEIEGCGAIEHSDMIKMEEFKDALPLQTSEYYINLLRQAKEEWDKNGENKEDELNDKLLDDHELGSDGNSSSKKEEIKEWLKQTLKDTIEDMKKVGSRGGNIPNHILALYNELLDSSVPWKQQLRKFTARVSTLNKQSTRKKRNRRYGLYQPGKKKNTHLKLAIAVDESGSIGENFFTQIFSEIDVIANYADIYVLQCDTQINNVYEYKKGKGYKRTGSGGTLYQPMFDKAAELEVDGLIIMGDGDCFEETLQKPNMPVLWAIEKGRNPPADWGFRCEVTVNNREE